MAKICILSALLLQLLYTSVQGQNSPCPDRFTYLKKPGSDETIGEIEIRNPSINNLELSLKVDLKVDTQLPTSFIAGVNLTKSQEDAARDVLEGKPLLYHIYFPVQNPLPTVHRIRFNNDQICSGPEVSGSVVTIIELEHTFKIIIRPAQNQPNPPPQNRPAEQNPPSPSQQALRPIPQQAPRLAQQRLIKPKHDKVVVCYVKFWAAHRQGNGAFSMENIRPEHCTHLIYAYAGLNASSWTIRSLDPWTDMEEGIGNYKKITAFRKQGLKVSLSIGGWNEGSTNYSMMASSPERRRIFIASTIEFLNKYGFDGLDLHWEFPGNRGGALYDKQNFVSLVKELKDAFREHLFSLTAAISAFSSIINIAYDIPEISKYLDYIHVMTYDYHGAWNRQVLPHSPLRSKDQLDVETTITYLLQQGAPPQKLVLGLAMYGRTFVLLSVPTTPNINPIGLPTLENGFKGPYTSEEDFMGFNEICEALVLYPQNWTTGWHDESSTAYAIRKDQVVVYDDRKAMTAKVEYVKRQKLAGVMVWSIDTDDVRGKCSSLYSDILGDEHDYLLMKSINTALANNTVPSDENQEPDLLSVQMLSNIAFRSLQRLSIAMIYLSL